MSDISLMFQWLNAHPQLAGAVTFLISAAESIAIIGTVVPGSITMTALGALAGAGIIPLWSTVIWAILGAVAGDGVSYWLGHHFKERLPKLWPFRYYPNFLDKGEKFFKKYGGMSVFVGRFIGPVRALVPLVAGTFGMEPLRFTLYNIASAVLWAPVYMLPGILLGAASLELPPDIAFHVILVLLFSILFTLLGLWLFYQLLLLMQNRVNYLLTLLWQRLKKSRFFSITTVVLKHHNPSKTYGQLTLAFYFLLTSVAFLLLAYWVKLNGSANLGMNDAMFHLFRSLRATIPDQLIIMITFLGQKQVLLPLVAVLCGFFIVIKRWRLATHTLMLGLFAAGGVYVIKNIVRETRPWGILHNPETYSFPSGHATLATTIYIGIAMIIASTLPPKRRKYIYFIALTLVLFICLSRLYLGVHWITDILGAWLLSTAILMLLTLSYNRKKETLPHPLQILVVTVITLVFTYGIFYIRHGEQARLNYQQLDWPTTEVAMDTWWTQPDQQIPDQWLNLFGIHSQRINIQWAGNLADIQKNLEQQGWTLPPEWSWINVVHRVMDIQSSNFLPLVAPYYLDKPPVLVLIRRVPKQNRVLVLRLWDANRFINPGNKHLWVGTAGVVPRTYSWIFKRQRAPHMEIAAGLIFPKPTTGYQWKIVTKEVEYKKHNQVNLKILLIR